MQTVIITGMSGAGKSTAVHILEDIGYYCIDNIPPTLIYRFITLCHSSQLPMEKIAFVADARSGELVTHLTDEIDTYKREGNACSVIFLDADDATITKRYQETRRRHPHAERGRIEDGILFERTLFSEIRQRADLVVDTSGLTTRELREKLSSIFVLPDQTYESVSVTIVSFGFKRGIPQDCDMLFDVRFMPNPFYDEELRPLTGKDKKVADYALSCEESQAFLKKLDDMVEFLLPQYAKEGKRSLVIAIGCTGGKHRSVAVSEHLGAVLKQKNYITSVLHRDAGQE